MVPKIKDYVSKLGLNGSKTLWEFIRDESQVRIIIGPVGSGKSTGCCSEIMKLALMQDAIAEGLQSRASGFFI